MKVLLPMLNGNYVLDIYAMFTAFFELYSQNVLMLSSSVNNFSLEICLLISVLIVCKLNWMLTSAQYKIKVWNYLIFMLFNISIVKFNNLMKNAINWRNFSCYFILFATFLVFSVLTDEEINSLLTVVNVVADWFFISDNQVLVFYVSSHVLHCLIMWTWLIRFCIVIYSYLDETGKFWDLWQWICDRIVRPFYLFTPAITMFRLSLIGFVIYIHYSFFVLETFPLVYSVWDLVFGCIYIFSVTALFIYIFIESFNMNEEERHELRCFILITISIGWFVHDWKFTLCI